MQLKHIKLSGFKSFVDPTKISFPTNMVGVVGPNGCGKSNVIDAIRWVLGELSAKNLRGESMVDVIFNGSENRKASGQCSIELLFDNSSAKIGGEYASFNEVSIKRVMTRDAQSDYFINNTKCRRKDVQDIFLGTGLVPSSWTCDRTWPGTHRIGRAAPCWRTAPHGTHNEPLWGNQAACFSRKMPSWSQGSVGGRAVGCAWFLSLTFNSIND